MSGFVSAVENEARGVWVVVHLYEPVRYRRCSISVNCIDLFFFVVAGPLL